MTVLRVTGLTRRFGAVQAVRGMSFEIAGGEVLGLLGPNGAGKTTVVDCVLGLTRADGGAITICGEAVGSIGARAMTGAVLQATGLQDKITPREALATYSNLSFPRKREANFLLHRFGLTEKADAYYETLSGGQNSVWPWHWPSWAIPSCWCWTNPLPAWTWPPASHCMPTSARRGTRGVPSC